MDKVVVTTISTIAVLLAAAMVVRWRDTEGERRVEFMTGAPRSARILEGVRVASAATAAGLVGGILGFGFGGRLMMRILAATSPDAQGLFTEAEERVGDVSTGGTVGLVVFIGLLGAVSAVPYVLLRRWLPRRSVLAALVFAGVVGGLLAVPSDLVNPDNRDFAILRPAWFAAVLCVGVVLLGALTIGVLVDRWIPRWPRPAATPAGIAGLLPLIVYVVPPIGVVGLLVIASRTVRIGSGVRTSKSIAVARVLSMLFVVGGVAGGGWIVFNAAKIAA